MTRQLVLILWFAGVVLVALGMTTAIFHTDPGIDIWLLIRPPVNSEGPQMIRTSLPPAANVRQ